jgi:hypothetical protein
MAEAATTLPQHRKEDSGELPDERKSLLTQRCAATLIGKRSKIQKITEVTPWADSID